MYTVGIDTSHQFLLLVLMDDNGVIDSTKLDCFKQQSEYIIPKLDELLRAHNLKAKDINSFVLAKGPGSYTGVRIGMTVVKVLGSIMNKNVYTLSTLQLYAGLKDCYVVMDARANRVYVGRYNNGKALMEDTIYTIEQMNEHLNENVQLIGDGHLFGLEDAYPDLCNNFYHLKNEWVKVENVDTLVPTYLKNSQEYMK